MAADYLERRCRGDVLLGEEALEHGLEIRPVDRVIPHIHDKLIERKRPNKRFVLDRTHACAKRRDGRVGLDFDQLGVGDGLFVFGIGFELVVALGIGIGKRRKVFGSVDRLRFGLHAIGARLHLGKGIGSVRLGASLGNRLLAIVAQGNGEPGNNRFIGGANTVLVFVVPHESRYRSCAVRLLASAGIGWRRRIRFRSKVVRGIAVGSRRRAPARRRLRTGARRLLGGQIA